MNPIKSQNLLFVLLTLSLCLIGCEGDRGPIGLKSLIKTSNEPASSRCENGGTKIDVGIDNNANGVLDNDEVTSTSYVCNGVDGNTSLTSTTIEPAGENCANGGLKIDSGIDTNGNGTLDEDEITATAYVCNGNDGNNSLTKITTEAAGANCETGGVKIDSGVDTNGNGMLDENEIIATAYACNGLDGKLSLVNVNDEVAGDNCENGGVKIESGVDDNGNGTLDDDEVSVERYVCNGIDGGFDEQIRLLIISGSGGEFGTNGPPTIDGELIDFDKRNWIGVDSIVFIPGLHTWTSNNTVFAELYDLTNNRVIDNSKVSTNSTDFIHVKSSNIFSDLPEEKIDLAIQLTSENLVDPNGPIEWSWARAKSYLMLYRNIKPE
ncbi:DUF7151 family protein [Cognatitamlana onchidii]|uniref:DUF7151 family protein n=1 Tax=Cognatitamlana onchidii TaxID=2562860 RepID=UPI0010A61204|nr:hypothetical protein [Algibacter onchidii]